MSLTQGNNFNNNNVATTDSIIELNASTAVLLAAVNPQRIEFRVYNLGNNDVVVRLRPASDDNDFRGVPVERILGTKSMVPYIMTSDNIYTGEISAISGSGTPSVYVLEY